MNKPKNSERKKTIAFFIICLLFGTAFGFFVGYSSKVFGGTIEASVLTFFNSIVAFIISNNILVLSIIWIPLTLTSFILLLRVKSIAKDLPIDEELEDKADFYTNIGIVIDSVALIYTFLIFACSLSPDNDSLGLLCIIFLITLTINICIQTVFISLTKLLHPEKKGDPMALNFQKQWIESCDEAERMMTYVIGFKTFMLMQNLLIFTFTLLMLLRLFLGIDCLSIFIVAILWATLTIANGIYAYKIEKGKIKY